ncbi:MAG: hypothetical protein ACK5MU_00865 [Candidatus Saccharimonadales bacterium]
MPNLNKTRTDFIMKKLKFLFAGRCLVAIPFAVIIVLYALNESSYAKNRTKPHDMEAFVLAMVCGTLLIAIYAIVYLYVRKTYSLDSFIDKKHITAMLVVSALAFVVSAPLLLPQGSGLSAANIALMQFLLAVALNIASVVLFIIHCVSISATRRKILKTGSSTPHSA